MFDGHGGAEVSAYCRAHFANVFAKAFEGKQSGGSADKHLRLSLERAFLNMDVEILSEAGGKELAKLAKSTNPPSPELSLEDAAKYAVESGADVQQFADFLVSDVGISEVFAEKCAKDLMRQVVDGRAVGADAPPKTDDSDDQVGPPRPTKAAAAAVEDEDEDEEDEDEDEEDSDDEDSDEDGEEGGSGATPGIDSGTTATVCLVVDNCKELVVANAGDSRCVLCRAGTAIDLSRDHKPEDDDESARITKAGGHVTPEGRVCGNLNLSRAIGDCQYKQNAELPAKEQMITAFPEIKSIKLEEKDEFMVLACDGVWNCMSSQECVDLVRKHVAGGMKLSKICELICDECCAETTDGDGTGCDNVTAMVVMLPRGDKVARSGEASSGGKRRRVTVTETDI